MAWALAVAALLFGAGIGARGLLDPHWAARLVRLREDEARPGGFAEFRATFGGLILFAHVIGLIAAHRFLVTGDDVAGVYAGGAIATLSAAWGGAALGRLISMRRDKTNTRFNRICVGVEVLLAAMLAAPWAFGLVFPGG